MNYVGIDGNDTELEAEILIGRDLDFNRLRQLAYTEDQVGFQKEMIKQ